MRVYRADDPVTCVVRGAGAIVEDLPRYSKVLANTQRDTISQGRRAQA